MAMPMGACLLQPELIGAFIMKFNPGHMAKAMAKAMATAMALYGHGEA